MVKFRNPFKRRKRTTSTRNQTPAPTQSFPRPNQTPAIPNITFTPPSSAPSVFRGGGGGGGGGSTPAPTQTLAPTQTVPTGGSPSFTPLPSTSSIVSRQLAQQAVQQASIQAAQRRRQRVTQIKRARSRLGTFITSQQEKKRLRKIKRIQLKIKGADILSGGSLTNRQINKKQVLLDNRIIDFNDKFGNKTLSEGAFIKANSLSIQIDKEQKAIDKERQKLDTGARGTGARALGIKRDRPLTKKEEKQNRQLASKRSIIVSKAKKDLQTAKKGKGPLKSINVKRLETVISGGEKEIARLKRGERPVILTGDLPLIPSNQIPKGISTVVFLGRARKGKGGKQIIDIGFKTLDGQVGRAKGVSIVKGKGSTTLSLGRVGNLRVNALTGVQEVKNIKSIGGLEFGLTKTSKISGRTLFDLFGGVKKGGLSPTLTKSELGLQTKGGGISGIIGRKKFLFFGKRKIQLDNFKSVAGTLTSKEISLIIGKTITQRGAKARFIGIIKGVSDPKTKTGFKLNAQEQVQFSEALNKVASTVAASLKSAQKTGPSTKAALVDTASSAISRLAKNKNLGKVAKQSITKQETKLTNIIKPDVITGTKFTSPVRSSQRPITSSATKQKSKAKTITKAKQKTAQETKQSPKTISRLKAAQRQRQRLRLRTRQLQRNKLKPVSLRRITLPPRLQRGRLLPAIKKGKKRIKTKLKPKKKSQGFNVFARPLKKRKGKRPRLVKVNKVPLRKRKAKDLRNFIVDTSLSRTGRIKPTTRKPKSAQLKVPANFAAASSKKFRRFRIIKGKRRLLPKGKVIERTRRLLDTRQEKRKITLRRRIKQLKRRKK